MNQYILRLILIAPLVICSPVEAASGGFTCTNTAAPSITSINSASAYGGYSYFASGSWLEIKGSNLADSSDPRLSAASNPGQWTSADFSNGNAPTVLDGISVNINGKPAFVWYLSPTQLNVQAPEDAVTGTAAVTVTNCHATSAPFNLSKQALAPGLLAPSNYSGAQGTPYLVATFASDGAYVLDTSLGGSFGLTSRPAKPGDVIVAYGVGFGDVTPAILPGVIVQQGNALNAPVTFSFGSTAAAVTYAGLAGNFVGLYEFYVTVPQGLASGDYQVKVEQNSVPLPQTFSLTVQAASPAVTVQSLTISPSAVNGGTPVTGTVTLSAAAPAGGAVIALSSDSAAAAVPPNVTVPAGANSASFAISTSNVSSKQAATVTANYQGSSAQAILSLTPAGSTPAFLSLQCGCTYQPGGAASEQLFVQVTADAGGKTYSAKVSGVNWVSGTASGPTLTFTTLQQGPPGAFINVGGGQLQLSSATLTFELTPTTPSLGSLNGTLTVTGTPFPGGGAAQTFTGSLAGSYLATAP